MDAVKFVEERRRMFAVTGENPKYRIFNMNTCAEDIVKEIEDWSAAHPRKTRQSVFLEQWPTAKIDESGCLDVCPYIVSATHRNEYGYCANDGVRCCDCRREFWMQEVE
nr:MAG TPA: hypothetical protein [Caudoviricetes sp.]